MTRLPARYLVSFCALLAAGCPTEIEPRDASPDANASDAGRDADGDAGTDAGSDAGTDAGPAPRLSGFLVDETGAALGNQLVLACMATVCFYADTDSTGRFVFDIDRLGGVALKTPEDDSITPRRGATLCPVHIIDETPTDVGTVYVPNMTDGALVGPIAMDPQTLSVGDGLELTVRRADLTGRVGQAIIDVAAREIPLERRPRIDVARIAHVYALYPTATTSSSPIAVRAPTDLPAGTRVFFRTISEIDGTLSEPIGGESDGSFVTTDPPEGITELTWLVISED